MWSFSSLKYCSFRDSSVGKESACNVGDLGSTPGFGRVPGEGNGYSLQYSGLKNSIDCIVQRVAKSRTQLSDFPFNDAGGGSEKGICLRQREEQVSRT